MNAVEIVGKRLSQLKVVFSGAGAAGYACAKYFLSLGISKENLFMTDIDGVLYKGRPSDAYLQELAADTNARTLDEIIDDADVFVGLSAGGVLKPSMLEKMAEDPIVFAMANPTPEIDYNLAKQVRPDVLIATGRSDYPNQINNVLGFPALFRGALDVQASDINETMKLAATYALAALAREEVSIEVLCAYNQEQMEFGRDYFIPKPFDPRVLYRVAPAVANAAMKTGIARKPIENWMLYQQELHTRLPLTKHSTETYAKAEQKKQKRQRPTVLPESSAVTQPYLET